MVRAVWSYILFSGQDKAIVFMDPQQLWLPAQDLPKIKPDYISTMEGEEEELINSYPWLRSYGQLMASGGERVGIL